MTRNWESIALGSGDLLADLQPGYACGNKGVANGVVHLRMNNVTRDGAFDTSLLRRIPRDIAQKQGRFAEKGDVIFVNTNSTELVGKSVVFPGWREPCTFSNHLTKLRVNPEKLHPVWLHLCFRKLWHEGYFAANCVEFIGQSTFNREQLRKLEIPVPPLAEQRRLVTRIEALTSRLEQARQARQAAIAEGETVMQAAMQKAFGDADDFTEAPLGELCTMKTGKTPPTSCPEYFEGDLPFVCPADVGQSLRITTAARRLSRQAVTDGKANLFPRGTVLLVGIGSTVGKVGLAAADVCTNQQITGLTFPRGILPDYAAWFLTSQRAVIENAASDGGVPIINQSGMGQLAFRYPESTDEQRTIVARLDALRGESDDLQRLQREVEAELAAFTPALLAKAFRGEL